MVGAIIDYMFDGFEKMLDAGADVADHRKRLKRWIELNSYSDGWIAGFQLLVRARHEPALASIYAGRYARYRDRLAAITAKQQTAGDVRRDIPADILADLTGSIADGWTIMLPIETERFADERVDEIIDSVVELIQPPAAIGC